MKKKLTIGTWALEITMWSALSFILQLIAGIALLYSKTLIEQKSIEGWYWALLGSSTIIILMIQAKIFLNVANHIGHISLAIYGIHKYSTGMFERDLNDYLVIALTLIAAIILCWRLSKDKRFAEFLKYEMTLVAASLIGMALLSSGFIFGWVLMLIAFVAGVILMWKKKLYIIMLFQAGSVVVALLGITKLFL